MVSGKCNGAALVISTGASAALCKKSDSLLPDGVIDVIGEFEPGDVVELRDKLGIVLGRGLVNYRSSDCKLLAGKPAKEIGAILGWRGCALIFCDISTTLSSTCSTHLDLHCDAATMN